MSNVVTSVWSRMVGFFLTGLFAIMPLVVTVVAVVWVTDFVKGFVGPETIIGQQLERLGATSSSTAPYIMGWVLVLGGIVLLGVLVQLTSKKLLHGIVEPLIRRIPLVGSIYSTTSQVVGMLDQGDSTDLKGMSVVYCHFGENNGTGILALLPSPVRYHFRDRDYHAVYIPTSPIPMTGGLLFVPVDSVEQVEMSVDGLMSIYLSMGVTGPQFLKTSEA